MVCCTLLYVHSSFAIILMGKRELVALLSLSSWCLLIVVWLFLAVPRVCLRFVIVVFSDHTRLLFSIAHPLDHLNISYTRKQHEISVLRAYTNMLLINVHADYAPFLLTQ